MSDEEYQLTQSLLINLARNVNILKLDEFIARIEHARAIAPLFDPTAYMRAHDSLNRIHEFALAAREFQRKCRDSDRRCMEAAGS